MFVFRHIKMKKFKKSIILCLCLSLCLSILLPYTALAAQNEKNADLRVDALTAKKMYDDIIEKYGLDNITVTVDESKYVDMDRESFLKELNDFEKRAQSAAKPENNIQVEYCGDKVVGVAYPKKYREYAQKYISQLEHSIERSTEDYNAKAGVSKTTTESITTSIPIHYWSGASFSIGFRAKLYLYKNVNVTFSRNATNIAKKYGYAGLGSVSYVNLTEILENTRYDGNRTNHIEVEEEYLISATANGITFTQADTVVLHHSFYAPNLW